MTIFKRRKHRDAPQPKSDRISCPPAEPPGGCTSAPPPSRNCAAMPDGFIDASAEVALIEKLEKSLSIKKSAAQHLWDEAIELQQAINLMRRAVRMAEKVGK